jgi:hypothetical protein
METLLVGEKTGLVTGKPPPVSGESKAALVNANLTGQHASGKDSSSNTSATELVDGEKKVKSEKERTYKPFSYITP